MRLLCAFLVLLFWNVSAAASLAGPLAGRLFVVDPGHGVRLPDMQPLNPGAVAPNGVQEQQIVLRVGEMLAKRLRADGARVVLTRSYEHPYRIANDPRVDNRARAALANRRGGVPCASLRRFERSCQAWDERLLAAPELDRPRREPPACACAAGLGRIGVSEAAPRGYRRSARPGRPGRARLHHQSYATTAAARSEIRGEGGRGARTCAHRHLR